MRAPCACVVSRTCSRELVLELVRMQSRSNRSSFSVNELFYGEDASFALNKSCHTSHV